MDVFNMPASAFLLLKEVLSIPFPPISQRQGASVQQLARIMHCPLNLVSKFAPSPCNPDTCSFLNAPLGPIVQTGLVSGNRGRDWVFSVELSDLAGSCLFYFFRAE